MLRGIGSVFSFLTILPAPSATLDNTARYMYLFPAVGIVIGLLAGLVGLGLAELVDPILASLLVVVFLVVFTGAHHLDGLADFADGLMASGTKEKKLDAMKDSCTGTAGVAGTALYLAGLIIAVYLATPLDLLAGLLIGEILAKFSMVLMAALGNSAAQGSNSPFVRFMQDKRRLAAAFAIMIVPVYLVGDVVGLAMLGATISLTVLITVLSRRSFGGITGDVMGATNEITRLASLMVFVTI